MSLEGQSHRLTLEDLHVLEVLPEEVSGLPEVTVLDLGLTRHRCSTVEAGSQQLMSHGAELLVFRLDLPDRNGLELLGALELLGLRVPSVICSSRTRPTALEDLHPLLTVVPPDTLQHPEPTFITALERAHSATQGAMFRVIDYLRLAIELGQSADLTVHLEAQTRVQLEIVGGDLWNVYTPDRTGLGILETIAEATPISVEAKHLRTVPSERQITDVGTAVLRRLRRRGSDHGTQPVGIQDLATALETPSRAPDAAMPASPAATADTGSEPRAPYGTVSEPKRTSAPADDPFDRALAAGLDRALHRDYRASLAHFEEALRLRPGDRRVRHNIERVRSHLE